MKKRRAKAEYERSTDPIKARIARNNEQLRIIRESWKRTRPRSPEEARQRLMELADSLAKDNFGWLVDVFQAYLAGFADSLDKALGLEPIAKSGRPLEPGTDAQAQKIFELRKKGRSWMAVAAELGGDRQCEDGGSQATEIAGGRHSKVSDDPMRRTPKALALHPRCGAYCRTTGQACKGPAMANSRCRMHGGKSPGPPRGAKNPNYRHGQRTMEAGHERQEISSRIRLLRALIAETG